MDKTIRAGDVWSAGKQVFQIIGKLPKELQTPSGLFDWVAQDLHTRTVVPLSGHQLLINGVRIQPHFDNIDLTNETWTIYTNDTGETIIAVGDRVLQGVRAHNIAKSNTDCPIMILEIPVSGAIEVRTVERKSNLKQESEHEQKTTDTDTPTSVDAFSNEWVRDEAAPAH